MKPKCKKAVEHWVNKAFSFENGCMHFYPEGSNYFYYWKISFEENAMVFYPLRIKDGKPGLINKYFFPKSLG